jgi:hypothetical protein
MANKWGKINELKKRLKYLAIYSSLKRMTTKVSATLFPPLTKASLMPLKAINYE